MEFVRLEEYQLPAVLEMYKNSGEGFDGDDWWSDLERLTLHNKILRDCGGGTFAISKDGRVVCHGDIIKTRIKNGEEAIYIVTLETNRMIRNAGLGTAFFNQLVKHSERQGITKIFTSSANDSSDRFYSRQGMDYYTYHYKCTYRPNKGNENPDFVKIDYSLVDYIEANTSLVTFPFHPKEYLFASLKASINSRVDCYGARITDIEDYLKIYERRGLYFVVCGNEIHVLTVNKNVLMEEGHFILTNADALANMVGLTTYSIFLSEGQYNRISKLKTHAVVQNINLSNFKMLGW